VERWRTAERIARQVRRLEGRSWDSALLDAEHGTLELTPSAVSTRGARAISSPDSPNTARRAPLACPGLAGARDRTDASLFMRVLANMLTNALEATGEGGEVRAWCSGGEAAGLPWACEFHVHNEAVMPRNVAIHVFQRSFSTKAHSGRGLGTYGMKLLGERYLGGAVSFVSREGEGTIFSLRLPRHPPSAGSGKAPIGPCF
jgi:signal transduction histidine kinase